MVQDAQVLLLRRLVLKKGEPIATAAAKAGMCETTARKYVRLGKLPSETKKPHTLSRSISPRLRKRRYVCRGRSFRVRPARNADRNTRKDPFAAVWDPCGGRGFSEG